MWKELPGREPEPSVCAECPAGAVQHSWQLAAHSKICTWEGFDVTISTALQCTRGTASGFQTLLIGFF